MKKYTLRQYNKTKTIKENILDHITLGEYLYKNTIDTPTIKNMDLLLNRLVTAIQKKEYIGIFADTDMDGTCGNVILYKALTRIPNCKCIHSIGCDRAKSYGITKDYYDEMKRLSVTLVITADIGISNIDEIEYGNSIGIETLCTDHHPFKDEPNCIFVNPADKDNDITPYCGASLAYVTMKMLYDKLGYSDIFDTDYSLLALAGMATIGDMVPLIKDNYVIAKLGLKALLSTNNIPLRWLVDNSLYLSERNYLVATDISFSIAPLVNALNRVSNPNKAIDFFISQDEYEVETLGRYMIEMNNKRKQLQLKSIKASINILKDSNTNHNTFAFVDLDVKHTIAGLVSSYITTEYLNVPSIVVSKGSDGIYRGSGRSIGSCSLLPLINNLKKYCIKAGGHEKAVGLSFDESNKSDVIREINNFAVALKEDDIEDIEFVECKLSLQDITDELIDDIYSLEPYGMNNPIPLFYSNNVHVSDIECKNFNTFFQFENQLDIFDFSGSSSLTINGVAFKKDYSKDIDIGDKISMIYSINPDKTLLIKQIKKIDN